MGFWSHINDLVYNICKINILGPHSSDGMNGQSLNYPSTQTRIQAFFNPWVTMQLLVPQFTLKLLGNSSKGTIPINTKILDDS